jgi:aryl-alcohol dehydrogenase-like predicted oxidoreductase
VIVWSPLAGGWLSGKYRRGEDPAPEWRPVRTKERNAAVAARYDLSREANLRKFDIIDGLSKVAADAGLPLTHLAIAFTLAHPSVTSAIIGPRTMEQLEDLLAGADVRLDPATLDAIDAIVPPGTVFEDADRGWTNPWLEPTARRR